MTLESRRRVYARRLPYFLSRDRLGYPAAAEERLPFRSR